MFCGPEAADVPEVKASVTSAVKAPQNIVFRQWLKGMGDFQDGGCFSRFLKRERINDQTFITFLNLTLTMNLISI